MLTDDSELEAARARLEKLVRADRTEPEAPSSGFKVLNRPEAPTSGFKVANEPEAPPSSGFKFETAEQQPAPPVDDVANGLEELEDIGLRITGNFILLVEICVGGLTSPVGIACCVLFALLIYLGEFGDSPMRFVTAAPGADTGSYYQQREPLPETYGAIWSADEASEDPSQVLARLRGGAAGSKRAAPPVDRRKQIADRLKAAGGVWLAWEAVVCVWVVVVGSGWFS